MRRPTASSESRTASRSASLGNDTPLVSSRQRRDRADAHRRARSTCRRRSAAARSRSACRTAAADRGLGHLLRRGQEPGHLRAGLAGQGRAQPVPRELIVPADLTDWQYRAPPRRRSPSTPSSAASCSRRAAAATRSLGHLPLRLQRRHGRRRIQPRRSPSRSSSPLYRVSKDHPGADVFDTINGALARWRQDQQALGPEPAGEEEQAEWRATEGAAPAR